MVTVRWLRARRCVGGTQMKACQLCPWGQVVGGPQRSCSTRADGRPLPVSGSHREEVGTFESVISVPDGGAEHVKFLNVFISKRKKMHTQSPDLPPYTAPISCFYFSDGKASPK